MNYVIIYQTGGGSFARKDFKTYEMAWAKYRTVIMRVPNWAVFLIIGENPKNAYIEECYGLYKHEKAPGDGSPGA